MTSKTLTFVSALAAGVLLGAGCATSSSDCDACNAPAIKTVSLSKAPCMDALGKFTASNGPALGQAESEVPAPRWSTNTPPTPEGLPGKGMAQHPMLYIGE